MKQNLLFVAALFMSLSAFAANRPDTTTEVSKHLSGRVGLLVLNAMKASGIKATSCKDNTCTYTITDFYAADETDGCGGGTTSYETSFKYADRSEYSYRYCEGSVDDGGDRFPKKNKAEELVNILQELDYFETSGWTSSASLTKIECYAERKFDKSATCVLSQKK